VLHDAHGRGDRLDWSDLHRVSASSISDSPASALDHDDLAIEIIGAISLAAKTLMQLILTLRTIMVVMST
jgi:hypothetical protein